MLDRQTNDNIKIHEMISGAMKRDSNKGKVLKGIILNNEFHTDINEAILNSHASSYKDINFLFISKYEVLQEALDGLDKLLNITIETIDQAQEAMLTLSEKRFTFFFEDIIKNIELFTELSSETFSYALDKTELHLRDQKIFDLESHLLRTISQIDKAHRSRDLVLINDLLEYELKANLVEWKDKVVPEVWKKVSRIMRENFYMN